MLGAAMLNLVAMKGHPGCGKSTVARRLGQALKWPVLDKDDVRDSTADLEPLLSAHAASTLNAFSYQVMWRLVETQLRLGLSVIVDSTLSRTNLYETAAALAERHGARLVVIECVAADIQEWKRRLEARMPVGSVPEGNFSLGKRPIEEQANEFRIEDSNLESGLGKTNTFGEDVESPGVPASRGWHKPACWEDLQKLIRSYHGCWEYDTSSAKKLVIDTTSSRQGSLELGVIKWLEAIGDSTPAVSYLQ